MSVHKPKRTPRVQPTRFKVGDRIVVRWSKMPENPTHRYRAATVMWAMHRYDMDAYRVMYDIHPGFEFTALGYEVLTEEEALAEEARMRLGEKVEWPKD